MKDIFTEEVTNGLIERIQQLNHESKSHWGVMNVSQMLAHCSVTYEFVYESIHARPNFFMKLLLKLIVKPFVVNEVPFKKNLKTAPAFIMTDKKEFEVEQGRLIAYMQRTQKLGKDYFEGKESHSFGKLNKQEWNNMFFKHLDHHLMQFGV